ncbi:MAG: polyprenol monophosphomannose synthase [Bacteroidetes bacterium]|nr:polyprenol monophosphomannose synthase [Bacteroidota bacterium]
MAKNLVIISIYNEKENVEKMLCYVFLLFKEFHVLIVDDGSLDGIAEIVKKLQQEYPSQLFIEERKGKLGLGTAYIHGFKWAIKNQYDYIFEMDCDFSHNPDDLIRLLEACETTCDLAIGSRYTKGGSVKNWPLGRIMMSYFASVYVRMILWLPIKDTTAGFKCYKRKVLEAIKLDSIRFMGYAFQIEMKYNAYKKGFKLQEVPISFKDREEGYSKMSTKIFKEAFWGVLQMRFKKVE